MSNPQFPAPGFMPEYDISAAGAKSPASASAALPVILLEWSRLDYQQQCLVLSALSRHYGTFYEAHQAIKLNQRQIDRWLARYNEEKAHEERWNSHLARLHQDPNLRESNEEGPIPLQLITLGDIRYSVRFLEQFNQSEAAELISPQEPELIKWPLNINTALYNPDEMEPDFELKLDNEVAIDEGAMFDKPEPGFFEMAYFDNDNDHNDHNGLDDHYNHDNDNCHEYHGDYHYHGNYHNDVDYHNVQIDQNNHVDCNNHSGPSGQDNHDSRDDDHMNLDNPDNYYDYINPDNHNSQDDHDDYNDHDHNDHNDNNDPNDHDNHGEHNNHSSHDHSEHNDHGDPNDHNDHDDPDNHNDHDEPDDHDNHGEPNNHSDHDHDNHNDHGDSINARAASVVEEDGMENAEESREAAERKKAEKRERDKVTRRIFNEALAQRKEERRIAAEAARQAAAAVPADQLGRGRRARRATARPAGMLTFEEVQLPGDED